MVYCLQNQERRIKMFRTERQRELSHFVAELKDIVTEKCLFGITNEETKYVYSALAANLISEVSKMTYEDLNKNN